MALRTNNIIVDGLTADPVSPENGQTWYRSDLGEWRVRKNGQTKKLASRGTGAGDEDVPKCNVTTSDPTATDDSSAGYSHCSLWVNSTTGKVFVCQDETATAAIWIDVTAVGSGDMVAANNLSDLTDASAARTNLGVDAAGTDNAPLASTTVKGKIEIATQTEVNTGTATTLAVTPSTLAGSTLASDVATNNAKVSFPEAPNDGQDYVRKNLGWSVASSGATSWTKEKKAIAGSNTGTWVTRALGAGYANKQIEIVSETSQNANATVGIRAVGVTHDVAFAHGRGMARFETVADASGNIELKCNDPNISFWITGTK